MVTGKDLRPGKSTDPANREGCPEYLPALPAAGPGPLAKADVELVLKAKLLDLITDPIFVSDFAGAFILVNEAACRSFGYRREELMGLNLQQFLTPELARVMPQRLKELQDQGELFFESSGFRKDGSIMPLEIHAQVLDFQGSKLILSVARDLSERKRNAEIQASITAQI